MLNKFHYNNEKSKIIPIKNILTTQNNELSPKGEYSLKKNFFDPSKSSPPNEFMIKLHMRMSNYNSNISTKDNNRESE